MTLKKKNSIQSIADTLNTSHNTIRRIITKNEELHKYVTFNKVFTQTRIIINDYAGLTKALYKLKK